MVYVEGRPCSSKGRQAHRLRKSDILELARIHKVSVWDEDANKMHRLDDICAALQRTSNDAVTYAPFHGWHPYPSAQLKGVTKNIDTQTGFNLALRSLSTQTTGFQPQIPVRMRNASTQHLPATRNAASQVIPPGVVRAIPHTRNAAVQQQISMQNAAIQRQPSMQNVALQYGPQMQNVALQHLLATRNVALQVTPPGVAWDIPLTQHAATMTPPDDVHKRLEECEELRMQNAEKIRDLRSRLRGRTWADRQARRHMTRVTHRLRRRLHDAARAQRLRYRRAPRRRNTPVAGWTQTPSWRSRLTTAMHSVPRRITFHVLIIVTTSLFLLALFYVIRFRTTGTVPTPDEPVPPEITDQGDLIQDAIEVVLDPVLIARPLPEGGPLPQNQPIENPVTLGDALTMAWNTLAPPLLEAVGQALATPGDAPDLGRPHPYEETGANVFAPIYQYLAER